MRIFRSVLPIHLALAHRAVQRASQPHFRAVATSAVGRSAPLPTELAVGYCTDVEGDLRFWHRYCDRSSVLMRDELGSLDLASESCHFVFGGDSVDKGACADFPFASPACAVCCCGPAAYDTRVLVGGRDLAFLRELLDLKDRHPERVHLVLGNRDINKMRLAAELAAENWLPCAPK